jgi:hypothetical protein
LCRAGIAFRRHSLGFHAKNRHPSRKRRFLIFCCISFYFSEYWESTHHLKPQLHLDSLSENNLPHHPPTTLSLCTKKHASHPRIDTSLSRLDVSLIRLAACAASSGAIRLPDLILTASIACFIFLIISLTPLAGQMAPSPSPTPEDIVEISPFVVTAQPDEGYRAANTLAGSRMNAR